MRRDRAIVCGDLNNIGDLLLVLQNLHFDGPGSIVRRWGPLETAVEEQVRALGSKILPGRNIVLFAYRCIGRDLVIGGGQLVRDNTALRSLIGILLAALAVRSSGGRVTTRGLGVGRLHSGSRKILWRLILRMAEQVNVRDQVSERHARSLVSAKINVVRTADMAFLNTVTKDKLFGQSNTTRNRNGIVIAPCIDRSEGRTLMGSALDALLFAAQARALTDVVSIACHDPRPGMDLDAANLLIERYPTVQLVLARSHTLPDIAELYTHAELLLTNRLHAMIMAAHAGTPVIALDHPEGKLTFYGNKLNISVIDPDAPMDKIEAQAALAAALGFDHAARDASILRLEEEAAGNLLQQGAL